MLMKSCTVLFLTDVSLEVARVNSSATLVEREASYSLDEAGLVGGLERVTNDFGRRVRFILPEKYLYVTQIRLDASPEDLRSVVEQKITDVFPESLDTLAWDYELIATNDDQVTVEVSGVVHDFGEMLRASLEKVHCRIEALIPESYALAQLVPGQGTTVLIHENQMGWVMALITRERVVASIFLDHIPTEPDLREFLIFSEQRKSVHPEKILLSVQTTDPSLLPLCNLPGSISDIPLNPMLGAAKIALKKRDSDRLDLPLRTGQASWFSRIKSLFKR